MDVKYHMKDQNGYELIRVYRGNRVWVSLVHFAKTGRGLPNVLDENSRSKDMNINRFRGEGFKKRLNTPGAKRSEWTAGRQQLVVPLSEIARRQA